MELFDTHAHLNLPQFEADLSEVLERARSAGVRMILCIGTDLPSSRRAVELARRFPDLIAAAVGIHPNHAAEMERGTPWKREIASMARLREVAAIGESGLDYVHDFCPRDLQQQLFRWHIALARRLAKPLVVHSRRSDAEVLRILAESGPPLSGVKHCFSGSTQTARAYLKMGFYISFAANLAREGHKRLKAAAAAVPPGRLLVETDSPYLVPPAVGTARNEPGFLGHTLMVLSRIRRVEPERLAERTTANALRLFSRELS